MSFVNWTTTNFFFCFLFLLENFDKQEHKIHVPPIIQPMSHLILEKLLISTNRREKNQIKSMILISIHL